MRNSFVLPGALIIVGAAFAQGPPTESPEMVLRAWEKAMKEVRSYAAVVKRTTEDNVLKATDIHQGSVVMRKVGEKNPSIEACLDLTKTTDKKSFEKYVVKNGELFEYSPATSIVRFHKLPKDQQGGEPSILAFVFGMSADQAKARYDMSPTKNMPKDGFHYIDILPKNEVDKRDFTSARLAFSRSTGLLAQVAYRQAHSVIVWDFDKVQRDVKIPDSRFEPSIPTGWALERVKLP